MKHEVLTGWWSLPSLWVVTFQYVHVPLVLESPEPGACHQEQVDRKDHLLHPPSYAFLIKTRILLALLCCIAGSHSTHCSLGFPYWKLPQRSMEVTKQTLINAFWFVLCFCFVVVSVLFGLVFLFSCKFEFAFPPHPFRAAPSGSLNLSN